MIQASVACIIRLLGGLILTSVAGAHASTASVASISNPEFALIAGLALAGLIVLWIWMLRRNVAARTRELQREQSKLRSVLNASPDGMWVKNPDGVFVDCNHRAAELLGVERKNLIGHTNADLFEPQHVMEVEALDKDVMRLGKQRARLFPIHAPDGTIRQTEIVKAPLTTANGATYGVLSVARDVTSHLENKQKIRFWVHAFEHAGFGLAIFDARTETIISVNPAFAEERGYTPEEMTGMSVDSLYPEDLVAKSRKTRLAVNRQEHTLVETEQITRDGRRFPVQLDCTVSHDAEGRALHAVVYARDISKRRRNQSELRLAAAAFETQAALIVMDPNRIIQRVNNAFTELTGLTTGEVVGKPSSVLQAHHHDETFYQDLWERVGSEGASQVETWIRGREGPPRVVRLSLSKVHDASGAVSHYVGSMVDLTGEQEAYASIDNLTFFDQLTGLPNRQFLLGRLEHRLDEPESNRGALFLINLDHFKRVNDLRGHFTGDRLLRLVGERLRNLVDDDAVLCRFNGGTFALLYTAPADQTATIQAHARQYAEKVRQVLRARFELDNQPPVTVTVSIGWTEVRPSRDSAESVLKEAELAMYEAKDAGRDQVRDYEPAMQVELARQDALTRELREAIAEDALDLHLQSQVDRRGRVTGAEALLRWTRSSGEPVSPGQFIPLAEENGLILPLGEWVLQRACALLVRWCRNAHTRELSLSVNVSAKQFAQPEFVDSVQQVLGESGADAAKLQLELTETAILDNLEDAASKLSQLRTMGLRISLDDFGTGYSSLAYLSRLPLDELKIDRSFVSRLPEDLSNAMVAQTIIAMGRGLGIDVIAEGVETVAQHEFLTAQDCDGFQGFLFARPQPRTAFEAALKAQRRSA